MIFYRNVPPTRANRYHVHWIDIANPYHTKASFKVTFFFDGTFICSVNHAKTAISTIFKQLHLFNKLQKQPDIHINIMYHIVVIYIQFEFLKSQFLKTLVR